MIGICTVRRMRRSCCLSLLTKRSNLVRNFGEDCYLLLGFLGKPRHKEMFVESQSCLDAEPFHYCERGTICERIRFIRMLNEVPPCFMKQLFINMDQFDGRARQDKLPNFNRLGVSPFHVKKSDDLIKNIGSCHQRRY